MGIIVTDGQIYTGLPNVKKQANYSLYEQCIGTWIDGSALYSLTLTGTGNGTVSLPFIDTFIGIDSIGTKCETSGTNYDWTLNAGDLSNTQIGWAIYFNSSSKSLVIAKQASTILDWYVTIIYTRGTPSLGDGSLIYSIQEQKIGKWIDGSDIYSKTIVGTGTGSSEQVIDMPYVNEFIGVDSKGTKAKRYNHANEYSLNAYHPNAKDYGWSVTFNRVNKQLVINRKSFQLGDWYVTVMYTKSQS